MESQQNLTDSIYKKIPFFLLLCPCLLLITYIYTLIEGLLKLFPVEGSTDFQRLIDFSWKYMGSDSHKILLIIFLLVLVSVILFFSTKYLIEFFADEEGKDRIISVTLILFNIATFCVLLTVNFIVFKILLASFAIGIVIFLGISGLASSSTDH